MQFARETPVQQCSLREKHQSNNAEVQILYFLLLRFLKKTELQNHIFNIWAVNADTKYVGMQSDYFRVCGFNSESVMEISM
jgi:hypothetical protein